MVEGAQKGERVNSFDDLGPAFRNLRRYSTDPSYKARCDAYDAEIGKLAAQQEMQAHEERLALYAYHAAFIRKAESESAQEQNTATPAPAVIDGPGNRRAKKPSIETVAFDYMRAEYKKGQFQSAEKFHKHLIKTSGQENSPFEIGKGENARKLFCPSAGSFFDAGTLGKMWAKIRAA